MKNLKDIVTAIEKLDEKEFDILLKTMQTKAAAARMAKEAFLIQMGSKVKFDAKTRGIITGEIVKVNPKTVKVKTERGIIWNVSRNLIQAA